MEKIKADFSKEKQEFETRNKSQQQMLEAQKNIQL